MTLPIPLSQGRQKVARQFAKMKKVIGPKDARLYVILNP
jgi:hypothetical protein